MKTRFTLLILSALLLSGISKVHAQSDLGDPSSGSRPRVAVVTVSSINMAALMSAWGAKEANVGGDGAEGSTSWISSGGSSGGMSRRATRTLVDTLLRWERAQHSSSRKSSAVVVTGRLVDSESGQALPGIVLVGKPGSDMDKQLRRFETRAIDEDEFLSHLLGYARTLKDGSFKLVGVPRGVKVSSVALVLGYRPEPATLKVLRNDGARVEMYPFELARGDLLEGGAFSQDIKNHPGFAKLHSSSIHHASR